MSVLAANDVPVAFGSALPVDLSEKQSGDIAWAGAALAEATCSTIHGFCHRPITSYPVETDVDPGASVTDRDQAEFAFGRFVDDWMREEFVGEEGGVRGCRHPVEGLR